MKQNLSTPHSLERYKLLNDLEYRTSPCEDDKQKYLLLILHQMFDKKITN
jgi:hypothetical protein